MSKVQEFFNAVRAGDSAAVSALLAADPSLGAARNEQGQSALLFAVYNGRNEIRDLLLARGVPLDLFDAAAAGQLVRVKELVEKDPASANSFSPDGFPVFALAAVFNQRAVAEYLLSRGADVNSISQSRWLHRAHRRRCLRPSGRSLLAAFAWRQCPSSLRSWLYSLARGGRQRPSRNRSHASRRRRRSCGAHQRRKDAALVRGRTQPCGSRRPPPPKTLAAR